jgi:aspartate/methionine/tyrosine aminotransferase
MNEAKTKNSAFREVPYMGVIWVVAEAMKTGFYNGNPEWSNLGQGQPEVGEMEGAPPRITHFNILPTDQAYGPINGTKDLREVIANHYNNLFRKGKFSKYTADHVSVAMGGRLVLTRIFATLGKTRLGYQIPDYTAYEDMINYHPEKIEPVLIPTTAENSFSIPGAEFRDVVRSNKLDAYLFSNPCNPTGHVVQGAELNEYVRVASEENCALISDEFYSHFIYDGEQPGKGPVSAAEYLDDVDADPVLIVDGLTKSFRYPGWRLGWVIGPKSIIENINRAASAVDGGPSQPIQRAALEVLEPARAKQDTDALRKVFSRKRNYMVNCLRENGITVNPEPSGTFYVWADISQLPAPINNADVFFAEALKRKVMTVPGHFFHVAPGNMGKSSSPFNQSVRFSFGPDEANMKMGLGRITEMIQSFR